MSDPQLRPKVDCMGTVMRGLSSKAAVRLGFKYEWLSQASPPGTRTGHDCSLICKAHCFSLVCIGALCLV